MDDLERAGAFVVALDSRRSWVRYHHLFAGLLQLELRRTRPGEVAALHGAAARWYAAHGSPAEPVRHARAALDWDLAGRLLFGITPWIATKEGHSWPILAKFGARSPFDAAAKAICWVPTVRPRTIPDRRAA